MPKLNINDQEIYYEIRGKADAIPLILLSGLGQDHTLWDNIVDDLATTRPVILMDNRGVGQSSIPTLPYTIKDMALDVHALIAALDFNKVDMLGFSMGGMIAQEFALNFSHQLNKLVLCSSLAQTTIRTQRLLLATARLFELGNLDDAFNSILTNSFGDKFLNTPDSVKIALNKIKNNPYPQSTEAFHGQFSAICQHNTTTRLHNITAPTLIIGGVRDILSLRNDAEFFHDNIEHSILEIVPEVAHQVHIENPALFLEKIKVFLSKPSPSHGPSRFSF